MIAWSKGKICAASLMTSAILISGIVSRVESSEVEIYAGRSISLVIGFGVGGGYDVYARLLGRFMSKYVPSNPKIVPQNMTGAGSLRAANYLYSVAPEDGSVIGTFSRTLPLAPLLARAPFDSRNFTWLGSVSQDVTVCFTWHTSPIRTWEEFLTTRAALGGEGPGAEPDIYALLFKNIFGAKVKLVSGYHGTNDIFLAIQRGEIDGACGISWGTVTSLHSDWVRDKKINVIVQAGLRKHPDLTNIPFVMDLVTDREHGQIIRLILTSLAMARPFAAPPNIPANRREALVSAFEQTVKDSRFRSEAERLNLDVNLVPAREIEVLLSVAYATPKDLVAKTIEAISR
jgi:tripartite-type tricarboxylate transporter receptor subunit TctC